MKFRALLITLLLLVIAFPAYGAVDLRKLTRLDGVSLYADEGESRLVVRFNRVRGIKTNPQFFEKSIQLDIEGAYINPSKRNFDLGGKIFKTASAYQISPTKVRLRFFLNGDPREYARDQKVSLNSNLMIITLKNMKPSVPVEGFPKEKVETQEPVDTYKALYPPDAPKFRATADPSVKEEEAKVATKKVVKKVRPAAVSTTLNGKMKKAPKGEFPNLFAKKAEAGEAIAEEPAAPPKDDYLNYKDPEVPEPPSLTGMAIKMVTALCFTLAAVFFLGWIGKKYMGKFSGSFGRSALINVLATSQIDVKKRIAVVDIAGEVLVLGIAGDNIAMLSTIDDQETADRFRQAGGQKFSGKGDEKLFAPIGAKVKASPVNEVIKKAIGLFRIGQMKASTASMRSLFDTKSDETFEGNLARFQAASKPREEQSRDALLREELSRGTQSREGLGRKVETKLSDDEIVYDKKELVRRVTNAIKTKNGKLRIA